MSSPPAHQPTAEQQPEDPDLEASESTLKPAVAAPPKQRRRPALIGLGVALVALGGLGAAWLATSVSDSVSVIAMSTDVPRGQVIERADLTTADINTDPSLEPVRAGRIDEIVGQHATSDLSSGSLLTLDAVADTVRPGDGEALVGVAVTAAQLPAEPLRPGDSVRIVDTPNPQDDPPSDTPNSIEAVVVRSTVDQESGQRVVDVVVPEGDAASLAARVATGRITIVLMSRTEGE
ncbi:SAF domain-containing protein [Haloactinopolyspora alba]|uniref:SAF domain-containing protein n=1 Tax=Haloactinopolyspora alba TaxID=648780 RepID=A0A2P8DVY2_9ACTN|nr:SAF domain-containing protein [Haloactinopolyspora alba]PSL01376.1 SAF domain-containing protein [Haloactinopolyspora alba]